MQAATGTLISGSLIPAIMSGNFRPTDVDFYTPKGAGLDVSLFLKRSGDWKRTKFAPTYNFASGIGHVFTLRHRTTRKRINIIESLTPHALDAVVQFHSTCVIGAISADAFWHGYAHLALSNITITTPTRMPLTRDVVQQTRAWKILRKYKQRGFDFHLDEFRVPHVCCEDVRCPATIRTSDDVGCSRISLPAWGLSDFRQAEHISCWTLHGSGCPGGILSRAPASQIALATNPIGWSFVRNMGSGNTDKIIVSHWRLMMNHLMNLSQAPDVALGLC
ncbi:hypothetical protein B0H16DRAFT_1303861 [Mycena metata]|uniref:Uncharacterized protein n=1 Tax=Mycena metata TaxID=1033252 RepID=A0AAD7K1D1_9AGAR|nr:hypothetical protein B0H16DRAFT_1303861 [Mycena metata]